MMDCVIPAHLLLVILGLAFIKKDLDYYSVEVYTKSQYIVKSGAISISFYQINAYAF